MPHEVTEEQDCPMEVCFFRGGPYDGAKIRVNINRAIIRLPVPLKKGKSLLSCQTKIKELQHLEYTRELLISGPGLEHYEYFLREEKCTK